MPAAWPNWRLFNWFKPFDWIKPDLKQEDVASVHPNAHSNESEDVMSTKVVDAQFPELSPWGAQEYALIVKLHAKPGMADALENLLLSVVEPTRAEPGCVFYQLNRDVADENNFHFYEAYRNRDAFLAHLAMPYIRTLLIALPPYLAKDNEMVFLYPCGPFA